MTDNKPIELTDRRPRKLINAVEQTYQALLDMANRPYLAAIRRQIESDPKRHRVLVGLFSALGAEAFEAFIKSYSGEDLHVPSPQEMARWDRNSRILVMFSSGIAPKKIAKRFGISEPTVYEIAKREAARLQPSLKNKATRDLVSEIKTARARIRRKIVLQRLTEKK